MSSLPNLASMVDNCAVVNNCQALRFEPVAFARETKQSPTSLSNSFQVIIMPDWTQFSARRIKTSAGELQARIGGEGPPLVLLHGFPQTHVMWEKVAPALADHHQIICVDLPGYGLSDAPKDVDAASKRAMANQIIEAMAVLGHDTFDLAGHDRGGRVAYRMALDHPGCVSKLAVLDILPTVEYWANMDAAFSIKIYHWMFLAQPEPLPETLISGAPEFFIDHTLASWTGTSDLSCFSADALDAYHAQARDSRRVKAMCDDYRAGATVDASHDESDKGNRTISCPTLVLWGGAGIAASAESPLLCWQQWCDDVQGKAIDSGHFIPEENPAQTISALNDFFNP